MALPLPRICACRLGRWLWRLPSLVLVAPEHPVLAFGVWRLAPSPPLAAAEPLVLAWLAVLGAPAS